MVSYFVVCMIEVQDLVFTRETTNTRRCHAIDCMGRASVEKYFRGAARS